ncbi:MAG: translation initiation factor IF-2 subunit beta [Nanoarchaeota archaeon]|nr:translation initiation factor IF-2 subunit beta [Nanoarchaeota archaeon]
MANEINDYDALLKRAREELPDVALKSERFEMPRVKGHVEGNKTIIANFLDICNAFRREPAQVLKYLQRELATPAHIDGPRLILGRKLTSVLINNKLEQFARDFVLCPECSRPDTVLKKEGGILVMHCTACGAKHTIKAKIA